MTWLAPKIDRTPSPTHGDEHTVLTGWLDYQRDTLLVKCAELGATQLKTASAEPSNLTLLGIVRHLTEIERWFHGLLTGSPEDGPYYTDESPDAAFDDLAEADAETDYGVLVAEIGKARAALSTRSLDDLVVDEEDEEEMVLRTVVVHLIEEYARHNGHADLLRERIDGAVGD
ncbi:putative damage-inducible protein DinB [Actinoalloteichus hoggarensis]|uniref:Uncharacterized protein n=1 Tax=Actinoalloteichus hoggarensis TaxID=1470176 RepID=A0A221VYV3_9PSEU|nr:DUF664 domain-containing protein [Actinoalloteichus hoggarensis]ASO18722.1 hypothetical protein AHOG_05345 [Actinoalloteichus hoggarensis]MBB5919955.1 putative damage-inducible protein DinB [Actinoalloteichus hoggarensis]